MTDKSEFCGMFHRIFCKWISFRSRYVAEGHLSQDQREAEVIVEQQGIAPPNVNSTQVKTSLEDSKVVAHRTALDA